MLFRSQKISLLSRIASSLRQTASHVSLYPVVNDEGAATLIESAFRGAGWIAISRPMGTNYVHRLAPGQDFASYWASRPGKLRSTVKRKGKGDPFRIELLRDFSEQAWNAYVSVYRRSWKQTEASFDFLKELAKRESTAGTLRMGFAYKDDVPVAAQLWTVENGEALIHKLAYDSELASASPGTLLSHAMFRDAIDNDHVRLLDYGTGGDAYKADWMDEQRPLIQIDLYNPARPSAWLSEIGRAHV